MDNFLNASRRKLQKKFITLKRYNNDTGDMFLYAKGLHFIKYAKKVNIGMEFEKAIVEFRISTPEY